MEKHLWLDRKNRLGTQPKKIKDSCYAKNFQSINETARFWKVASRYLLCIGSFVDKNDQILLTFDNQLK